MYYLFELIELMKKIISFSIKYKRNTTYHPIITDNNKMKYWVRLLILQFIIKFLLEKNNFGSLKKIISRNSDKTRLKMMCHPLEWMPLNIKISLEMILQKKLIKIKSTGKKNKKIRYNNKLKFKGEWKNKPNKESNNWLKNSN